MRSIALVLLLGLAAGCQRGEDLQAISAAAARYVENETGREGLQATVEAVEGDFARARVVAPGDSLDPVVVFLREDDEEGWYGLVYGTAFGPDEYQALEIPRGLWTAP